MVKLSEVFGIGPEHAAQLEECGVRSVVDLAQLDDLEELSRCSSVPLDQLRSWQVLAEREARAWRLRRKVVAGSVGAVVALAIVLVIWSGAEAPTPAERAYNRALEALAAGDTAAAERVLDGSLSAGIVTAYLHNLRGVLYRKAGEPGAAARQFVRAVEVDSSNVEAWSNLGSLALAEGDPRHSVEYYERALALEPERERHRGAIYLNLSLAHSRTGDVASARDAVERAIDLNPDLAAAYVQRGYLQQRAGELEKAEASYRRALGADSDNVLASHNLSLLRRREGGLATTSGTPGEEEVSAEPAGSAADRIEVASGRNQRADEARDEAAPEGDAVETVAIEPGEPIEILLPGEADSLPPRLLETTPDSIVGKEEPEYQPVDVEPRLKDRHVAERIIEEEYPERLRNSRIEGEVIVWVKIDVEGNVRRTQVWKSSGFAELDSAATAAARRFVFTPAIYQDNPVAVWVQVPLTFSVRD